MAYAEVSDVQARVPTQLLTIDDDSQPTYEQVEAWLVQQSAWVDNTLRWRYSVPITDATDVLMLKPIVAALVAGMCWQVMAAAESGKTTADSLRSEALGALAYNRSTGRSMIVLPSSAVSDSGEAALQQPDSTFDDPDDAENDPRFFTIAMDF